MNICKFFDVLIGMPCWNVRWDINLNLKMEFGQPHLDIWEPKEINTSEESLRELFSHRLISIRGEWLFWIINSYWKLSINNFGAVTGASSYKKIKMALARLNGQKLCRVIINPATSATQMEFDLGAQLSIRRYGPKYEYDMWSLHNPKGYVLTVRADGKYLYCSDDTQPENYIWESIVAG